MQESFDISEIQRADKVFESRGLNGNEDLVQLLKITAAGYLATINRIAIPSENKEAGRLVSLAKTAIEESVMWAVKAVSRG